MPRRVDPDIEKILPLLPLKDASTLTMIAGAAGPIAARVYRPARVPAATVVFFHGGGWVAGDIVTHDRNARTLAIELEAVVVSADYRRPPEAPFPGTFEDCLAATAWAAKNIAALGGDAARLAVAGDSAGGNLAAAVAIAARDRGLPLAGQFLVYPATNLAGAYRSGAENARYPSRTENADGYFLTSDAMRWFAGQYVPKAEDASDPRASPLLAADLRGLPQAVICTAEFDPLRDEGEAYARALEQAGVRVVYYRESGMVHGYFSMGGASPAAAAAGQRARAAFKALLDGAARAKA
jgi:acetyl esterase